MKKKKYWDRHYQQFVKSGLSVSKYAKANKLNFTQAYTSFRRRNFKPEQTGLDNFPLKKAHEEILELREIVAAQAIEIYNLKRK